MKVTNNTGGSVEIRQLTGPSREELDRLAQQINHWPFVAMPRECQERIRDLLRAYPLPPEGGEREEIARAIEGEKWAGPPFDHPALGLADDAENALEAALDEAEGDGILDEIVELLRDAQSTVAALAKESRRAAALLRQPLPPPTAGVSKAEVLAVVNRLARRHPNWQELYDDIEALPEVAPPQELVNARWQIAYMCEEIGTALGTGAQSPADTVGSVRLLMEHAERMKAREAAAPPSGVDREAAIEAIRASFWGSITGTCWCCHRKRMRHGGHAETCLAESLAEIIRALPEAKPLTPGPPTSTLPT